MTLPVLVGENNTHSPSPQFALFPFPSRAAGARLHAMLKEGTGISKYQYLRLFDRVNLLFLEPGEKWSGKKAKESAERVLEAFPGRDLILCGRKVAGAFAHVGDPLDWIDRGDRKAALLPHPSGRNRWYNSAENKTAAIEFLRETLEKDYKD